MFILIVISFRTLKIFHEQLEIVVFIDKKVDVTKLKMLGKFLFILKLILSV